MVVAAGLCAGVGVGVDDGPVFGGAFVGFQFAVPYFGFKGVEKLVKVVIELKWVVGDARVWKGIQKIELAVVVAVFVKLGVCGVGTEVALATFDAGEGDGDTCFLECGEVFVEDLVLEGNGSSSEDDGGVFGGFGLDVGSFGIRGFGGGFFGGNGAK